MQEHAFRKLAVEIKPWQVRLTQATQFAPVGVSALPFLMDVALKVTLHEHSPFNKPCLVVQCDLRYRTMLHSHAALKEIPIVGMAHETIANKYTIDYFSQHDPYALPEVRRVLDPSYGADWGGQLFSFLPYGTLVGRLVGASVSRLANAIR